MNIHGNNLENWLILSVNIFFINFKFWFYLEQPDNFKRGFLIYWNNYIEITIMKWIYENSEMNRSNIIQRIEISVHEILQFQITDIEIMSKIKVTNAITKESNSQLLARIDSIPFDWIWSENDKTKGIQVLQIHILKKLILTSSWNFLCKKLAVSLDS